MLVQMGRAGRVAGVDDLDLALDEVVAVPVRLYGDNSLVQVRADLPRRAYDHALASGADELAHLLTARLPVGDHVLAQFADPVRGAVDGVHRGDPLLDALPLRIVQARRDLVGPLVDVFRLDARGEVQLDQAGLIQHRHGRAVLDGLGEVVDQLDALAEHVARVPVRLRDRRAGERDVRGVRQRVLQVPGVAVERVAMRAVRLVDDHNDVPPVGQARVPPAVLPFLLGAAELLQRGEDDPAHPAGRQRFPQLFAAADLDRLLRQEVAGVERGEELVVQVGGVLVPEPPHAAAARLSAVAPSVAAMVLVVFIVSPLPTRTGGPSARAACSSRVEDPMDDDIARLVMAVVIAALHEPPADTTTARSGSRR